MPNAFIACGIERGLKVPKKQRKTRHSGQHQNGCAHHPAEVWAWDFEFDRTSNGTMLKWLLIVDGVV